MTGKARVYGKGAPATPFVRLLQQQFNTLGRRLLATARAVLLAALATSALVAQAGEEMADDTAYRFGDGLHLPGTGLSLGGYATATVDKLQHAPARATLEDISLFVWWESEGRWKFFSEFDFENLLSTRWTGQDGDDPYLALERIYFDYALTDTVNLRVGKFLTPIGRWNLIHATPLVWTSSRPLVTLNSFPSNVSGLMINGSIAALAGTEYSFYASGGTEIRSNPTLDPFNEVIGGHLTLPRLGNAQIGLSYANFEQKKTLGEHKELFGIDFVWSKNRYELSAEGVYRVSDIGRAWDEKGAFVQLVAPLSEKLYAVGRYENFRKAQELHATELWVTGLNYRITPAVVLKAEWISGKNNNIGAPEGLMSSVSILF